MSRITRRATIAGGLLALASLTLPLVASAGPMSPGTPVQMSHVFTTGVPPASLFRGSTKGDGWGLAVTSERVYNVFHHQPHFTVDCHITATAAECPNYPSRVSDGRQGFVTPMDASLWSVPSEHRLYAFAYQQATGSAGVVCMKTDQPLTPFCGFTQLSEDFESSVSYGYSVISNTVTIGKRHYAWNSFIGANTGSRNTLMCFDDITKRACPNQPYRIPTGSTSQIQPYRAVAQLLAVGGRVIVTSTGLDRIEKAACFDAATQSECTGVWPMRLPAGATPVSSVPLPLLDSQGFGLGVCFQGPAMPCVDLTGARVATPPGLAEAVDTSLIEDFNGEPSVVGSRVYVAIANFRNYGDNKVACYDFATESTCPNFPYRPANMRLIYTTNQDPQVPSCIWLNSDGGTSQIQNFDAYTTKACGLHAQRILVSGYVEPEAECEATSYQSLSITSPTPDEYTNGVVTFENGSGKPIAGLSPQVIDSDGNVDLSGLGLENHPRFVQFSVSLPGAQHQSITMTLHWTAKYQPECVARNQAFTALPTTTTTEVTTTSTSTPSTSTSTTTVGVSTTVPVTPLPTTGGNIWNALRLAAMLLGTGLVLQSVARRVRR